jgi:tight adherence protein B
MALLIACIVFVMLLFVLIPCFRYMKGDRDVIHARMLQYVERKQIAKQITAPAGASFSGGWSLIRSISKYFEFFHWSRLLEHKLIQAGLPIRGAEFVVICLGVALLSSSLLVLLSGSLLLVFLGGIFGFCLPLFIMRAKIERRTKAFNLQLGDTLVLVANSLRTGYSFMQAIEMVSREMPKPIGEEFGRVLKEMNLGVPTEDAMNNMAKRIDSDDLDLAITAVLIQRQVGGNLAEVLTSIASTIRERVKIKGQIKTLTAQGRISGLIIGILPFGIGGIIYVLNPEYMRVLFTHPMGKAMLAAGLVSELIGMMVIRKIINIDI